MKRLVTGMACLIMVGESLADTSLIKIDSCPHAKMQNVGLDEVTITGGFWKERREVNRKVSLEVLWIELRLRRTDLDCAGTKGSESADRRRLSAQRRGGDPARRRQVPTFGGLSGEHPRPEAAGDRCPDSSVCDQSRPPDEHLVGGGTESPLGWREGASDR